MKGKNQTLQIEKKYNITHHDQTNSYKLIFTLNNNSKTAYLIKCHTNSDIVFIPRSIKHETQEFFITNICEKSFSFSKMKSLKFDTDSKLQTIEKKAFEGSSVECISIPSTVSELKEGWCCDTRNLKKLKINPGNHFFMNVDRKLLIGKSNFKGDEYDILIFVSRDQQSVVIPSFIKRIASHSFEFSLIEKISIPSQITQICGHAFSFCTKLRTVEIPQDSNLQIIGKYAFSFSGIKDIFIPRNVKKIAKFAFADCSSLSRIEFAPDSELYTIEKHSFERTEIESITIPPHIKTICRNAFIRTFHMKNVDFAENSELKVIEKNAFFSSAVERITIPSNVSELKDGWCADASELKKVTLSPHNKHFLNFEGKLIIGKSDTKGEIFDVIAFANRDIKSVTIPENIRQIAPYAFAYSDIEKIIIQPNITLLGENSFYQCKKLQYVEIPSYSELEFIDSNAFAISTIKSFFFPSSIKGIDISAFGNCEKLRLIEFDENFKLLNVIMFFVRNRLCQNSDIMIPTKIRNCY